MPNTPDFVRNLELFWGGAYECDAYAAYLATAANVILGTNPPYGLADFFQIFPKFFGPPQLFTATITQNSNQITVTANPNNITFTAGTFINDTSASFFPPGTIILSVLGSLLTLSNPAMANGSAISLNNYPAPWLPLLLVQLYINLATASLVQARWLASWPLAMALFVAHYCTLWIDSESGKNKTASQVATSGLQRGIMVSEGAGDVSAGLKPIEGLEEFGAWNLTQYGVSLATQAKAIGSGIMYVL